MPIYLKVRILDRYVIRQLLMPFGIGLLVFTFLIIIPEFMRYAEDYIAKGAPMSAVAQVIVALLPMALGLTIPMSLLMALLVAFGRLSADREFVAFQACGVSPRRLLIPVGLVSVLCFGATAYVLLVSVPAGNQRSREITFNIIASQAEGEVKPRIFFDGFPNIDLYVREIPPSGGWNGVFMSDNRGGEGSAIYNAKHGRVVIDRAKRSVEVVLERRHAPLRLTPRATTTSTTSIRSCSISARTRCSPRAAHPRVTAKCRSPSCAPRPTRSARKDSFLTISSSRFTRSSRYRRRVSYSA